MRNADCGIGVNGVILLSGRSPSRKCRMWIAQWGQRRFRDPERWPRGRVPERYPMVALPKPTHSRLLRRLSKLRLANLPY